MIILIGGEKGGTGKTTLATNLAVLRAREKKDVLLLDTDKQGSASCWAQMRGENNTDPSVNCVQLFGKGLGSQVGDLAKRYEDIIIDAGGRDSVELRAAMVVADKVFIPFQPSQYDVWTLDHMQELVVTARGFNPDLEAYAVISRASTIPQVTEYKDAQELFADYEHLELVPTIIRDRISYRKTAREGLSVIEHKPSDEKAVSELQALYEEVFKCR
jgi:chromosome partitioning protein